MTTPAKIWLYDESDEKKQISIYYILKIENNVPIMCLFHKSILVTELFDDFVYSQKLNTHHGIILHKISDFKKRKNLTE